MAPGSLDWLATLREQVRQQRIRAQKQQFYQVRLARLRGKAALGSPDVGTFASNGMSGENERLDS